MEVASQQCRLSLDDVAFGGEESPKDCEVVTPSHASAAFPGHKALVRRDRPQAAWERGPLGGRMTQSEPAIFLGSIP